MNLKRMLKMLVTLPNSPNGLRLRAEKLEEDAKKPENFEYAVDMELYAQVLRQLADKNYGPLANRRWIRDNLRSTEGSP